MDWANERWVRFYTRDTDDWLLLSWQARGVFMEIVRKVDRAGVLETRRGARGVAALVRWPVEVVASALPELLEDGCLAVCDRGYVLPNFIAAQETPASDRQRAKESRDRRRTLAVTSSHVTSRDGSNRDESSRNVTDGSRNERPRDDSSRRVTSRHVASLHPSDPSDPTDPDQKLSPAGARDPGTPVQEAAEQQTPRPDRKERVICDVWAYHRSRFGKCQDDGIDRSAEPPFPMPAGELERAITARLNELLAKGLTYEQAEAKLRHRVDVAEAECRRPDVHSLKWFKSTALWGSAQASSSFWRALETSVAEASAPRAPPKQAPATGAIGPSKPRTDHTVSEALEGFE